MHVENTQKAIERGIVVNRLGVVKRSKRDMARMNNHRAVSNAILAKIQKRKEQKELCRLQKK